MSISNAIKKIITNPQNIDEILHSLCETEIVTILEQASDAYYNSGDNIFDDFIYDTIVEYLREINPNSPWFHHVGAPIKGKKIKLPYWMGSMDKFKSGDQNLDNWIKNHPGPYVISNKLDGISCLLICNGGDIKMYTRGDGAYGQDISHLVQYIKYNYPANIVARGELIMSDENFKKYEKTMKNARNMVAGIVNSKPESVNPKHVKDVDLVIYEIIKPIFATASEQLESIDTLDVVDYDIYKKINYKILDDILEKRKQTSNYTIDGIIITDNNPHKRNITGNPSYSFAYKGSGTFAETVVTEVVWHTSKDKRIVPTVKYEPVNLSGATLTKAAGHNAKFIVSHKIGKGSVIKVTRSGDTIPYILDVMVGKKPDLPDIKYEWDETNTNIYAVDDNDEMLIEKIIRFMTTFNVEGVNKGVITKFYNAGYDNEFKILKMMPKDIEKIDGFADVSAQKIYDNIHKCVDNVNLVTLMTASNEFGQGFGNKKLMKIVDAYPKIVDEYKENQRKQWHEKLIEVDDISDITAGDFLDKIVSFQKYYKKMEGIIKIQPHKVKIAKSDKFKDEVVVFTGFRNKDWEKYITENGGRMGTTVSGKTTLVVYSDGDKTSSKMLKAVELGIKTIEESKFEKTYIKN